MLQYAKEPFPRLNQTTFHRAAMFYLQLRNELWKLFAKKRTYIGFLMFLLAQNVIMRGIVVPVEK